MANTESVVGEFETIDEVIDFIDLPEEYGREWTVDIRDNREWSSEGFQDGLSHFGIGEIFDVVDTQPDPLDDHSSVEAYRAARGIAMPEDQEHKEQDYWTPEVKVGSQVMWDRRRRHGIVDEVDVENGIAVVLDDDAGESIVDLDQFDVVLEPIEDEEYNPDESGLRKVRGPSRALTPEQAKEIDANRAKLNASKVKRKFGKERWE